LLHEITKVTFNELSDETILYYIDNFNPYDKAGAYGIQNGWVYSCFKIEGSYANVMGLPVDKVYDYLNKLD
jgi:septum formation protein